MSVIPISTRSAGAAPLVLAVLAIAAPAPLALAQTLPEGGLSSSSCSSSSAATPPASPPDGALSLADAITAALARSPQLEPLAAELAVRGAERHTAALSPNPTLTLEQENFAGTGATRAWRSSETTLALEQVLELGGKRARRVRVAELAREVTSWDHAATRAEVVRDTAEAFVRALAAGERVTRARERVEIESALRDALSRGVRSGAVSTVDERRAAFALIRSRGELDDRVRDHEAARRALAATWGERELGSTSIRGDLAIPAAPPSLDDALERMGETPEVARWETEIAEREAALALEAARAIPDLSVGAGARFLADGDDVAMVASIGVPLPLFDRNRGAIDAAHHQRERAIAQAHAARAARASEIRAAHQRLVAAHARDATLRTSLIPEAEALHRDIRDAYHRGLSRLSDVLEAERALSELHLEAIDVRESYHLAALALPALLDLAGPRAGTTAMGDRP